MRYKYREIRLSTQNFQRLQLINSIIEDYQAEGYKLTLRQLYYQLVSREVIPNQTKEYNKLSVLLKEGRMGGYVDWNAIEDRLRVPQSPSSFSSPEEILEAAAEQFSLPRMKGQSTYIEVWVEKDALSGVLSRVTHPYHIPILVNRGYSSASAMHDAYLRFRKLSPETKIRILYLGDFDPSGMDMVRDVESRICEFYLGANDVFDTTNVRLIFVNGKEKIIPLVKRPDQWPEVCRESLKLDFKIVPVALTRSQIDEYQPPPNPAKRTDTRYAKFSAEHGDTSWEVDALRPEALNEILTNAIEDLIDRSLYEDILTQEEQGRSKLRLLRPYLTRERLLRKKWGDGSGSAI